MTRTRRNALALLALSALGAGAAVACSDAEERESFDSPDTGAAGMLPEAQAPGDAATDVVDARAPFDPTDEEVTCPAGQAPCVTELAAGEEHLCARLRDGTVRCWGDDTSGALGRGTGPTDAGDAGAGDAASRQVVGLTAIAQISAADRSTCARDQSGAVYCWGSNARGQLGRDGGAPFDEARHPTPVKVALPGPATRVDVGHGSACAVLADAGAVSCWGDNAHGQLARETGDVAKPGLASLGTAAVVRTNAGTHTGFALTSTAELSSFGALSGDDGVVAGRVSSISPDLTPGIILAGVSSFAVSASIPGTLPPVAPPWTPPPASSAHACAVVKGAVFCWGHDDKGALCTGLPDPTSQTPRHAPIASAAYAQQVAVGGNTTCVRMTDGQVQCCGADERGNLGKGVAGAFSTFFTPATAFTARAVHVVTSRARCRSLRTRTTRRCR